MWRDKAHVTAVIMLPHHVSLKQSDDTVVV